MTLLIGFGSNYYRALGGAEPVRLTQKNDNESVTVVDAVSTTASDIQDVQCTATASIFLLKNGKIHQTGTMHGTIYTSPLPVVIELPLKCVEIAAGRHFCVGRMEGGLAAVSWGAGHFGQLGHGPNVCSLAKPKIMEHLLPHHTGSPLKQVAVGSWHGLALLESGVVYAWGSNRRWQCGIKRNNNSKTPPTLVYPQPMDAGGVVFTSIACGKSHSVALSEEHRVYTWGASHFGQCGHATRRSTIAPPKLVEALQKLVIVQISAGDAHTLALTGGGRVFAWGSAMEGQLGLGPAAPFSRPKLVGDLDFVAICAGQEWKQQQQQSGNKMYSASPPMAAREIVETPADVPFLPSFDDDEPHLLSTVPKICSIQAAGSYSVAISSSGHLYTWGYNDVGVLGLPRPPLEHLVLIDPPVEKTSGRLLQAQTFDSRHNVLLPRRVDALSQYWVKKVAGGPSHMWCLCEPRSTDQEKMVVGRTLYEVQEERRQRGLRRLRQNMSGGSVSPIVEAEPKKSLSAVENGNDESKVEIPSGEKPPGTPNDDDDKSNLVVENGKDKIMMKVEKPSSTKSPSKRDGKTSFIDSEEEDDDDVSTTGETNESSTLPTTFTEKAQAAAPKNDSTPMRPMARLMRRLSSSKPKKQQDNKEKKKGRTGKVLKRAICKSDR